MNCRKPRATSVLSGLIGGTLLLFLGSCSTTQSYKEVTLPAFASAYFGDCQGRDGSSSLELFEQGRVQRVLDLEWASGVDGNVAVASYSPLGQTLFQLDYSKKSNSFKQSGQPVELLQTLAVSKRGMIEVDGNELGILPEELTCFLGNKLPQKWVQKVISEKVEAQTIQYVIADAGRTIRLQIPKHSSRSSEGWRADVSWDLYWGLKTLDLSMRLAKDEQALIMQSDQFKEYECRIVSQEE